MWTRLDGNSSIYFLFTCPSLHSSPINAALFPTDVENASYSCINEVKREIAKAQTEKAVGLQNIDQFEINLAYLRIISRITNRKYELS